MLSSGSQAEVIQLAKAGKIRARKGKIVHVGGLVLVHRAFPGKAALIFRKKYSESRNP